VLPFDERWERVTLSQGKISTIRVQFTTENSESDTSRQGVLRALVQRVPMPLTSPRWLTAHLLVQIAAPAVITRTR
jgi:hypothetical protein